jgi:glycosyltransferase involved in cell wall biosynthesis
VLQLIKGLGRGGAEQLLVSLVRYADRSRFDYEVAYVLPWKDAFVPEMREMGISATCLGSGHGIAWAARLRRLIREREIDLVHVHSPSVGATMRSVVGPRRPALVTTEHNVWERYHRVTYWANALTFARNDHVFAVSDEVRESIRYPRPLRMMRMPPIETLHHGIDIPSVVATPEPDGIRAGLGVDPDAFVVGSVANFKPHKGYEYLVRVAAIVARERPDTRFVIVGHGPLQDDIRRQAQALGVNGSLVFAGFREDALQVVRSFDVFALSSIHEGLPLALLEAMALGRPPVATQVGGVRAVIQDAVNGFVVPARDPQALAERLIALHDDGELRRRLGAAAAERAASFDVSWSIRRIEEIYAGLVS